MANDLSINVGGTWKSIDNAEINVGGVWKQVDSVKINVAGVWKTVWENVTAALTGASLLDSSTTPTDSEVGYQLTTGGLERSYQGIGQPYVTIDTWLTSGVASDFECRLTVNSGTAPAGSANGSWLGLGTTRAWTLTDTSSIGGPITNNCTIEIRDVATSTVRASATVTMSVEEGV